MYPVGIILVRLRLTWSIKKGYRATFASRLVSLKLGIPPTGILYIMLDVGLLDTCMQLFGV